VSCVRITYSPSLSLGNSKVLGASCWWNCRPLDNNWIEVKNHTRWRRIVGNVSPFLRYMYVKIFLISDSSLISSCWVGFDVPDLIFSFTELDSLEIFNLCGTCLEILTTMWFCRIYMNVTILNCSYDIFTYTFYLFV
jgi:hypothetical protein